MLHTDPGTKHSALVATLLQILTTHQTRTSLHHGQFGDHPDNSADGQPGFENMSRKPRLYMTLWPCRVLRRHGLMNEALTRAGEGVADVFYQGLIYGEEDTNPIPSQRQRFISYRHSICGALILFEHLGKNCDSDNVLARMLDDATPWRTADLGWAHSNARPDRSDLYTSLYAIQFLNAVKSNLAQRPELSGPIERALEESISYVAQAWSISRWAYGNLTSEESIPLSFCEVAGILRDYDRALFAAVSNELLHFCNPVGGLQSEYNAKITSSVSAESRLIRLAYAVYVAGGPEETWRDLAMRAVAGNLHTLTSAETAWLLDLQLSESIVAG